MQILQFVRSFFSYYRQFHIYRKDPFVSFSQGPHTTLTRPCLQLWKNGCAQVLIIAEVWKQKQAGRFLKNTGQVFLNRLCFVAPFQRHSTPWPPCSTNFLALPRKSFQKSASKRNKVVSTGLLVTLKETPFGPLGDHRTPLRNLALDLSRPANSTFRFHDWYHKSPQGFDIYMLLLWSTYLTVISNASHEGPQSQFVKCSKRNGADRLKTSS